MQNNLVRAGLAPFVCLLTALSLPTRAVPRVSGVGTNYVIFDYGAYNPNIPWSDSTNNWYTPGHNVKTPVGAYHLNPTLVNTQLSNIRASGIDVLVLFMQNSELATCESQGCNNGFNDGTWGLVIDNSQAALSAQMQQNLTALLNQAKALGFRKVFLRFSNNEAASWTSWQDTDYQRIWNFIASTRALAGTILANSATRLVVDLGAEVIGDDQGQNKTYVQRLWIDYTTGFGPSDTIGFSFNALGWNPKTQLTFLQTGLSWLSALPYAPMPNAYAFDIYEDDTDPGHVVGTGELLVYVWNALGPTEKTKPLMLMETMSNEGVTAGQISQVLCANPTMNLTEVVQWPTTRASFCCDRNLQQHPIAALATSVQVSNYLSIVKPTVIDDLSPSLLSFTDVDCKYHGSPCTVQGHMGYQPAGANVAWQVFVRKNDQARVLWACGEAATDTSANWIDPGASYVFEYYKSPSCTGSPGATAGAVSYLTFHACQDGSGQTIDMRSNALHCGSCDYACPNNPPPGQKPICVNSQCSYGPLP